MRDMFNVTVSKGFKARHALRGYRGGDESPHGHMWRAEATIEADSLDPSGCAVDFAQADAMLAAAVAPFEGGDLNELLAGKSPSAENVARHIFRRMAEAMDGGGRRVARVKVWEDAEHSAAYFET